MIALGFCFREGGLLLLELFSSCKTFHPQDGFVDVHIHSKDVEGHSSGHSMSEMWP